MRLEPKEAKELLEITSIIQKQLTEITKMLENVIKQGDEK